MQLAIFDIDGTLIRRSSERLFWRYLWARKRQGPKRLLSFVFFFLRYLPVGGVHTSKKNKAYLTGFSVDEIERLAADFVDTDLLPELYEPAVTRLKQHIQAGDTVLLISGTLEPIARALAVRLGAEHVCATLCSQNHGIFRARPPERHPFGGAKLLFARELARAHGFELAHATAYADSRDDIELLEAVGTPVAVKPDRALLAVAVDRNWEVLSAKSGPASVTAFQ